jgi:hypothetical protein
MNSENTQAQNSEQETPSPKLNPDFGHRMSAWHSKESTLTDSVLLMTDRALGVLQLIANQFYDEDCNRLNDALMTGAIDAAISEVEDIKALTKAYNKAKSDNRQA